MSHAPSFERDIGPLQHSLDDAFKGMRAAEAVLRHHSKPDARLTAINFPLEESLLCEAVRLLADWKAQAAALLRKLDAETAAADLQFARLFDENAGRQSEGFLKRRVHLSHVVPEGIAARLVDLLSISAPLGLMLKKAAPVLADHHRHCEFHVLQLVSRRQRIDVELEDVSRRIAALKAESPARQAISVSWRSPVPDAAAEEERRTLALARQAAQVRDEILQSERETLQRMIADDEDVVEALNEGIAATHVMVAKLSLDVEQRIALLKAVNVQSSGSMPDIPAPVQLLIAGFDANILAGHDLLARKQRVDAAFSRRLEASLPSPEEPQGGIGEPENPPADTPPSI